MSLDRDDVIAVVADGVGWVWLEESSVQDPTNWLPWISHVVQNATSSRNVRNMLYFHFFINCLHLAFKRPNVFSTTMHSPLLCMHVITGSWIFFLHLSSQNFEEKGFISHVLSGYVESTRRKGHILKPDTLWLNEFNISLFYALW